VVPDEKRTHSGASKPTRWNSASAGVPVTCCKVRSPPVTPVSWDASFWSSELRFGTWTVARRVGSDRCSVVTSVRRSWACPFHR
jgi:hypothetical protein